MWFEHARGPWPWRYLAEQSVSLNSGQLHITLSILNLDSDPMPAGIGLHPYFIRPQGLWLNANTGGRWATLPGETGLPHEREAAPQDLGAAGHDHCFYGWDRRAELGGGDDLVISVAATPALGNLVIYTPPGEAFFCAEPVSHVNNAVNMDELAQAEQMVVLGPGERLQGTMTISVRPA
jgi:aldose 1-epimerase